MFTLDHQALKKAGASGFSNSSYRAVTLTCCDRQAVEDVELSDLYFDATDVTRKISLLRAPDEAPQACPLCGATDWDLVPLDDVAELSQEWQWARPRV